MKSSEPIARLILSHSAMRAFFLRDGKNLRLKIENNVIYLKSTSYQGRSDIIAMARNRSTYTGTVMANAAFGGRFMSAMTSAGFKPDQPFFRLVAMDRRWVGLEHVPQNVAPSDGAEYLKLIAGAALERNIRVVVTNRAVETIKANLPVLSASDLREVMPKVLSLAGDIFKFNERVSKRDLAPLQAPEQSLRMVTIDDVARVLQQPPRPRQSGMKFDEPLTDEAAEAIIFEMVDG